MGTGRILFSFLLLLSLLSPTLPPTSLLFPTMQNAQELELAVRQLVISQSQSENQDEASLSIQQAQKIHRRPSSSSGISGGKKILPRMDSDNLLPTIPPTPIDSYPPSRDEPFVNSNLQSSTSSSSVLEANLISRIGIQDRPESFPTLFHEIVFALICSLGQLFFAWSLGYVQIIQNSLVPDLKISHSQKPWLSASYLLANGLSVVLSGSMSDHFGQKNFLVGGFGLITIANIMTGSSLNGQKYLFFVSRALGGTSVGALTSASISLLGQVYSPGLRKNRAFSLMASASPLGFWMGCIQGGSLQSNRKWIFYSFSFLTFLAFLSSIYFVPKDAANSNSSNRTSSSSASSFKQFDFLGAGLAIIGSGCIVAGVTQGAPSQWAIYAYVLVIIGVLSLIGFVWVESKIEKPLIPHGLWKVKGFGLVMGSYFLGFGGFSSWQFYLINFWTNIQGHSSLTAALFLIPNLIIGLACAFVVAALSHRIAGHWILGASCIAYALGPAFTLGNKADTTYWALSMPAVGLATLGPDLSFAATSIFITSRVPRSYQGAAGAFLITVQNLSSAIITSLSETIGVKYQNQGPNVELTLASLKVCWWFCLACSLSAVFIVCFVRIPKTSEEEHRE